jgi:hypothetical protein
MSSSKYHKKPEVHTMYTNVSMDNNSNIDKRDELHNNSLKNRRTSSKYPNTFIHPNHMSFNNDYMISIYTYSHIAHVAPLLLGPITLLHIHLHITCTFNPIYAPQWGHTHYKCGSFIIMPTLLHIHLTPYMLPLGIISYTFNPVYLPLTVISVVVNEILVSNSGSIDNKVFYRVLELEHP